MPQTVQRWNGRSSGGKIPGLVFAIWRLPFLTIQMISREEKQKASLLKRVSEGGYANRLKQYEVAIVQPRYQGKPLHTDRQHEENLEDELGVQKERMPEIPTPDISIGNRKCRNKKRYGDGQHRSNQQENV